MGRYREDIYMMTILKVYHCLCLSYFMLNIQKTVLKGVLTFGLDVTIWNYISWPGKAAIFFFRHLTHYSVSSPCNQI